jgi:Flp pilus assembly protein TadG
MQGLSARPGLGWRAAGQATVEFALVVILFCGAMVLVFEGARLVASYFTIANAASEAARMGQYAASTDTDVQTAARRTLEPWISVPNLNTNGSCTGSNVVCICRRSTATSACNTTPIQNGSVVEVTVKYDFRWMPFAGGLIGQMQPLTLSGYKRVTVE